MPMCQSCSVINCSDSTANNNYVYLWFKRRFVPLVCILSPAICYLINEHSINWFNGYKFGFELLILNGTITFIGLIIISVKKKPL